MTTSIDLSFLYSEEAKKRTSSPIKTTMKYFQDPDMIFLGAGMPPAELFPVQSLTFETHNIKNLKGETSDVPLVGTIPRDPEENSVDVPIARALQYGNSRGQVELLNYLKEHTLKFHNVLYDDWDIITTTGSTNAWDSTLRIFCNKGDTILLEEYTYSSSYEAAMAQGINCVPVKMDTDGIIVQDLDNLLDNWSVLYPNLPKPKLLYTIPTGQNPTGISLADSRKPLIYNAIQKHNMLLIEDEPYYFLQMPKYNINGENPLEVFPTRQSFLDKLCGSFLSLDTDGRVIRMESVSKTFAPGCRLGWIIGPKYVLDTYWNLHEVSIQSTCGFSQAIISGILNRWGQDGYVDWLIKMRLEYTQKRNWCLDNLFKYLPKRKDIIRIAQPPMAGMFFTLYIDISKHPRFKSGEIKTTSEFEQYLYQVFVNNGLLLALGSWFKVADPTASASSTEQLGNLVMFRGTYASITPTKMENGMKILGKTISKEFGL